MGAKQLSYADDAREKLLARCQQTRTRRPQHPRATRP